jgi:hypothetical protein
MAPRAPLFTFQFSIVNREAMDPVVEKLCSLPVSVSGPGSAAEFIAFCALGNKLSTAFAKDVLTFDIDFNTTPAGGVTARDQTVYTFAENDCDQWIQGMAFTALDSAFPAMLVVAHSDGSLTALDVTKSPRMAQVGALKGRWGYASGARTTAMTVWANQVAVLDRVQPWAASQWPRQSPWVITVFQEMVLAEPYVKGRSSILFTWESIRRVHVEEPGPASGIYEDFFFGKCLCPPCFAEDGLSLWTASAGHTLVEVATSTGKPVLETQIPITGVPRPGCCVPAKDKVSCILAYGARHVLVGRGDGTVSIVRRQSDGSGRRGLGHVPICVLPSHCNDRLKRFEYRPKCDGHVLAKVPHSTLFWRLTGTEIALYGTSVDFDILKSRGVSSLRFAWMALVSRACRT